MAEYNILACMPRDRSSLPQDPVLDDIVITDLYTLKQCENTLCGQDVWVGPRQWATYLAKPEEFLILCYMCAAPAMILGYPIEELGGGSSVEGRPRINVAIGGSGDGAGGHSAGAGRGD